MSIKIEEYKRYIEEYDLILVFDTRSVTINKLFNHFLKTKYISECNKKVLIMLYTELNYDIRNSVNVDLYKSSYADFMLFKELFYTYDFSNRIVVVDENKCFPNLLNYLSTQLLTEEEFFEALLH